MTLMLSWQWRELNVCQREILNSYKLSNKAKDAFFSVRNHKISVSAQEMLKCTLMGRPVRSFKMGTFELEKFC